MTKNEIAHIVAKRLRELNSDSELPIQYILRIVDSIRNSMAVESFMSNKYTRKADDAFYTTRDIPLTQETSRFSVNSSIASISGSIGLPLNSHIQYVTDSTGSSYLKTEQYKILNQSTDFPSIYTNKKWYWIEGNELITYQSSGFTPTPLKITAIFPGQMVDEDIEYPLPLSMESILIDRVVQSLMTREQLQDDIIQNNVENK